MKKLLLLILAALMLIGCTSLESNIKTDERAERYVYSAHWLGPLVEYDLYEKKSSYLCMDASCKHTAGCVYSSVLDYWVDPTHTYILYTSMANGFKTELYCYNAETKVSEKIIDCCGATKLGMVGEYAYFPNAEPYTSDEADHGKIWHIYRYHYKTGELERLTKEPIDFMGYISHTEKSIIWYAEDDKYYESDLNLENLKETAKLNTNPLKQEITVGEWAYFYNIERDEEKDPIYHFYRENSKDGTVERVLQDVKDFRLDGEEEPEGFYYLPVSGKGRELWYFRFDDLSTKRLCKLPKDEQIDSINAPFEARRGTEDYCGIYIGRDRMLFVQKEMGDYLILAVK